MTREDILRLGVETNLFIYNGDDTSLTVFLIPTEEKLLKFAALVAVEKEAQMIREGYRKCAEGQRTTQYCGLLDAAVKAEREACAKVAESYEPRCEVCPSGVSNAIRARNEQEQPR